jgi:hypothetical protein
VIVETKYPITFGSKKCVASSVAFLMLCFEMLCAVDLDDQTCIVTYKVDDEGTNGSLSPKACAIESVGTHPVPDDPLRVREISPQGPRTNTQLRRDPPRRFL